MLLETPCYQANRRVRPLCVLGSTNLTRNFARATPERNEACVQARHQIEHESSLRKVISPSMLSCELQQQILNQNLTVELVLLTLLGAFEDSQVARFQVECEVSHGSRSSLRLSQPGVSKLPGHPSAPSFVTFGAGLVDFESSRRCCTRPSLTQKICRTRYQNLGAPSP